MGVPLFENLNKMHHVKVVTNTAHFYLMELELGIITGPYPIQSENLYLLINEKQEMSLLSSLFNKHINNKINKWNKIIGIMEKLSPFQSRKTLLTIYKSFVKPNFDYTDSYNLWKSLQRSFKTKMKWSNIEQLLLRQGQLKLHHVIVFIKKFA